MVDKKASIARAHWYQDHCVLVELQQVLDKIKSVKCKHSDFKRSDERALHTITGEVVKEKAVRVGIDAVYRNKDLYQLRCFNK